MLWRIKPAVDQAAGGAFRLGVLASRRRSGASTVAANLAIRAADLGLGPVLLVDANLAAPRVQRTFRVPAGPGLVDACVEPLALSNVTRDAGIEGLQLLPAGNVRLLKRAGLNPSDLQGLLHEMTEAYEFVVFDLPAADRLGPSLPIAQALDAALLVLRSEAVSGAEARRVASRLAVDGIPLSGAIAITATTVCAAVAATLVVVNATDGRVPCRRRSSNAQGHRERTYIANSVAGRRFVGRLAGDWRQACGCAGAAGVRRPRRCQPGELRVQYFRRAGGRRGRVGPVRAGLHGLRAAAGFGQSARSGPRIRRCALV